MKKRKLTKKERKAQRASERSARGVLTGWDRAEATMWRDEFGIDVRKIGPDLIRAVQTRDVENRHAELERDKARWPGRSYWECSECAFLDTWPEQPDYVFSTCMGCGAAMVGDRAEASWANRGSVTAQIDRTLTAEVLSRLLDEWIPRYAAEARNTWEELEFDLAWGPDDVLSHIQDTEALAGSDVDLRSVDWPLVADGIASWLDDHPRTVNPVEFLEVARPLLEDYGPES